MKELKLDNIPIPFGVELTDIDLSICSKQDIRTIGEIFLDKLLVVIRNQDISIRKFATICYNWGNPFVIDFPKNKPIDQSLLEEINRVCVTTLPGVTKVNINSFLPDGELDWHSDNGLKQNPNDAIALYATNVAEDTCIDFLEGVTPYQKLSSDEKSLLDSLYCVPSFNNTYFPDSYSEDQKRIIQYTVESHINAPVFPLVKTNAIGHKGILYNRHMFKRFDGKTIEETKDLCAWIESIVLKEEYVHRHYWKNGDFLIMDQTLLLHRRPQQDCSRRELYRMMFDTNKLISLLQK
jgi:alpha-ketoglutarate-dependent taurine dioxygenase